MNTRPLVYVCQPLDDSDENIHKAKQCCKFLTDLGYNPFCPCLYYSSYLDFKSKKERYQALLSALDIIKHCERIFIFGNYVSSAMHAELETAEFLDKPVHYNLINLES